MKAFILLTIFVALTVANGFDTRQKWPHCVGPILDQARCGSCWDFASTEAFSDRLCISGLSDNDIVSPEPVLECSKNGCDGGWPSVAYDWMIDNGNTICKNKCKSGCAPYDSARGREPRCHKGTCDDGSKWKPVYHPKSFAKIKRGSVSAIQSELQKNGPLQACFDVYDNWGSFFDKNPTGIYTRTSGPVVGGHCVKLVGWGTSGGTDYWTFANSWASDWGDKGYFKMARGKNIADVENEITAGFTSKQSIAAEEGFYISSPDANGSYNETIVGGGWVNQTDLSSTTQGHYTEMAKCGLDAIGKSLEREITLDEVQGVQTQVVRGVNYRIQANSTQGTHYDVVVHRDIDGTCDLIQYDLMV